MILTEAVGAEDKIYSPLNFSPSKYISFTVLPQAAELSISIVYSQPRKYLLTVAFFHSSGMHGLILSPVKHGLTPKIYSSKAIIIQDAVPESQETPACPASSAIGARMLDE